MKSIRWATGLLLATTVTIVAPETTSSAATGTPAPFGRACKAVDGVRFCTGAKVPSFDGS